MGQQVECRVEFNGEVSSGKAMLESDAIHFRGGFRLKVPLKDLKGVSAAGGRLSVAFGEGTAVFDLGERAQKWLAKIKNPKGLLEKLGVKPGMQAVVLGVEGGFADELEQAGVGVSAGRLKKGADLIFFGAEERKNLDRLARLQDYMKRDGAVWVVAPKGRQHIKESHVLEAGLSVGLVDVKVVKFSETHTAHKFVIPLKRR